MTELRIRKLPHAFAAPSYASAGAAGIDLVASIERDIWLQSMVRMAIPTGFEFAIPAGFEGQVRPRSGRALREGLYVLFGTIDSDYRGELHAIVVNLSEHTLVIMPGDRIAQLVIAPVERVEIVEVDTLEETVRGTSGFGSTGR